MSQEQDRKLEEAEEGKSAKAEIQDAAKAEPARILHFREASGEAAPARAKPADPVQDDGIGEKAPDEEPASGQDAGGGRSAPQGPLPVGLIAEIRGRNGAPDMAALQLNERAESAAVASAPFFAACTRMLASRLALERAGWNLATCRKCGMGCPERRGQCRNVDFWLEAAFRAVRALGGEAPMLADVRAIAAAARRAKAGAAPAAPDGSRAGGDAGKEQATSTPRRSGDDSEKKA